MLAKKDVLLKYNISGATLDNWVRCSIPSAKIENLYDTNIIDEYIKSTNKLTTRANKKQASQLSCPESLTSYLVDTGWLKPFLEYVLLKEPLQVKKELVALLESRIANNISEEILIIDGIMPKDDVFSFSVAYQLLLDEGEKTKNGAYYTPKHIVDSMLEYVFERFDTKNKTFLEPCCGSGFFVLSYILRYKDKYNNWPKNLIVANDIDPFAAKVTELAVFWLTGDVDSCKVHSCNGLELPYEETFDFVISNPPYGIKQKYNHLNTDEIFSHFIHKCFSVYLKTNGVLSFVLPSSFLGVARHSAIRKYLIDNQSILQLELHGKEFKGVFSDIVVLHSAKNTKEVMVLKAGTAVYKVGKQDIKNNNYIFSFNSKEDLSDSLKVYNVLHITLKRAVFALGLVTGNNAKHIRFERSPGFIPVIAGKDVFKGEICTPRQFVSEDVSAFQQKPKDLTLFHTPKIVYKFISKDIVCAVDRTGAYTLNSANIIIPDNTDGVSLEYICAILNSSTIQQLFKTKFSSPLKVLKTHLQELPIFLFDDDSQKAIVDNYNKGLHKDNDKLIELLVKTALAKCE